MQVLVKEELLVKKEETSTIMMKDEEDKMKSVCLHRHDSELYYCMCENKWLKYFASIVSKHPKRCSSDAKRPSFNLLEEVMYENNKIMRRVVEREEGSNLIGPGIPWTNVEESEIYIALNNIKQRIYQFDRDPSQTLPRGLYDWVYRLRSTLVEVLMDLYINYRISGTLNNLNPFEWINNESLLLMRDMDLSRLFRVQNSPQTSFEITQHSIAINKFKQSMDDIGDDNYYDINDSDGGDYSLYEKRLKAFYEYTNSIQMIFGKKKSLATPKSENVQIWLKSIEDDLINRFETIFKTLVLSEKYDTQLPQSEVINKFHASFCNYQKTKMQYEKNLTKKKMEKLTNCS